MKKKGFTLVELLGVIILLSVIAVITIPVVNHIMDDARKNSFKNSMSNLVKAANNYYAEHQLEMNDTVVFNYTLGGVNDQGETLDFSGPPPKRGKVSITTGGNIVFADVTDGKYFAAYEKDGDDEIVVTTMNEVMSRDELTDAIKALRKENETLKSLIEKTNSDLSKKADQTDLDSLDTKLTSTTTLATTANNTANSLNNNFLNKTYPVGSIYISVENTNPSTIYGGTWVAFGTGRTLVGVNTSDTNFNAVEKTGGSSTTTLATTNLPSHTHSIPALSGTAASAGAHTHSIPALSGTAASAGAHTHVTRGPFVAWLSGKGNASLVYSGSDIGSLDWAGLNVTIPSSGAHTHTVTTNAATSGSASAHTHRVSTTASTSGSTGSGSSFTNLQPYITVYMWKRTA